MSCDALSLDYIEICEALATYVPNYDEDTYNYCVTEVATRKANQNTSLCLLIDGDLDARKECLSAAASNDGFAMHDSSGKFSVSVLFSFVSVLFFVVLAWLKKKPGLIQFAFFTFMLRMSAYFFSGLRIQDVIFTKLRMIFIYDWLFMFIADCIVLSFLYLIYHLLNQRKVKIGIIYTIIWSLFVIFCIFGFLLALAHHK